MYDTIIGSLTVDYYFCVRYIQMIICIKKIPNNQFQCRVNNCLNKTQAKGNVGNKFKFFVNKFKKFESSMTVMFILYLYSTLREC